MNEKTNIPEAQRTELICEIVKACINHANLTGTASASLWYFLRRIHFDDMPINPYQEWDRIKATQFLKTHHPDLYQAALPWMKIGEKDD